MDRVRIYRVLERGAQPLRRAGLGRLVDRARGSFERGLGERTVEVDGLRLTGLTALHSDYLEESRDEAREGLAAELFVQAARPGATVVDVGAHLGLFALLAARAVGPKGRVMAFEPNPGTLPLLRRNLADNGLAERVEVVDKAVAGEPGTLTFWSTPAGDGSSLHDPGAGAEAREVEVVTLDSVLAGRPAPSAIKIDVEGAEPAALAGMADTIARAETLTLVVECNPEALGRTGATPDALWDQLEGLGLQPHVIDEAARELRGREALGTIAGYANLLCRKRA